MTAISFLARRPPPGKVPLGLAVMAMAAAIGAACERDPSAKTQDESSDAKKSKGDAELSPEIQGSYLESWGPGKEDQSRHRFTKTKWERDEGGRWPARFKLELVSIRSPRPQQWSAVFKYPKTHWHGRHYARVDFLQKEAELYLCILRPDALTPEIAEKLKAANPKDLQSRGCRGFPWRQLGPQK